MRVSDQAGRRRHDEDGAAAIIVVISLLALFGVAALAIDVGSLWWTRRSLVVDVDAAALAAASAAAAQVAGGSCGVTATTKAATAATEVVTANDTATAFNPADPTNFTLACAGVGGRATVTATKNRGHVFANVFGGSGSTDVRSQGAAEFGPIVGLERLRPLPLCVSGGGSHATAYEAWREYETSGPPKVPNVLHPRFVGLSISGPYYSVVVENDAFQDSCNPLALPTPGDFRWIDFDGTDGGAGGAACIPEEAEVSGGGTAELKSRIQLGYACSVYTHGYRGDGETNHDDASSGHNCRPDTTAWHRDGCPVGEGVTTATLNCITGSSGCSPDQVCPLTTAASDCSHIWTLLLYDQLFMDEGELRFHPVGFVNAVPREVNSGGPDDRYVAVEFIAHASNQGVVGSGLTSVPAGSVLGVRLCAADDASPNAHSCSN